MGTFILLAVILGYTAYVAYKHFVKKEGCCEAGCQCALKEDAKKAERTTRQLKTK